MAVNPKALLLIGTCALVGWLFGAVLVGLLVGCLIVLAASAV